MTLRQTQQFNFASGQLDPRLSNRVDQEIYAGGASRLENCFVLPQGTVQRRPGTNYFAHLPNVNTTSRFMRVFPFVVTESIFFLVIWEHQIGRLGNLPDRMSISVHSYRTNFDLGNALEIDGEIRKFIPVEDSEDSPFIPGDVTEDFLYEMDFAQAVDVMIFVHPGMEPQQLVRITDDTFTLQPLTITNRPMHQFIGGGSEEPAWSASRGWPISTTFHGSRLWFGGTRGRPETIFGSRTGDYFNFDTSDVLDDYGIEITLETNQINYMHHLVSGRHLLAFTNAGEFFCPVDIITPTEIAFVQISRVGSYRCARPLPYASSFIYVNQAGNTVYQLSYQQQAENYTPRTLNIHAGDVIKQPLRIERLLSEEFATTDLLLFTNRRGDVACLSIDDPNSIYAWSSWTYRADAVEMAVINNIVFIGFRDGESGILQIDEFDYGNRLDHLAKAAGNHANGARVVNGSIAATLDGAIDSAVTSDGRIYTPRVDLATGQTSLFFPEEIADTAEARAGEVFRGFDNPMVVETMPLAPQLAATTGLHRLKRPVRVWVHAFETQSMIMSYDGQDYPLVVPETDLEFRKLPVEITELLEIRGLSGYTRDTRLSFRSVFPGAKMGLQGITAEVALRMIR